MPAIPQVDVTIRLKDTGYKFRFDELDGSTTLGNFGFEFPFQTPQGLGGYAQNFAAAFFPSYTTMGGAMTPTPTNYALGPSSATGFVPLGAGGLPDNVLWGLDGANFLQVSWDAIAGTVQVQNFVWPGVIDYSMPAAVTLTITNAGPISGGGVYPVNFTDGSRGFIFWALVDLTHTGLFVPVLLPILISDLAAAVSWVIDPTPFAAGLFVPTVTTIPQVTGMTHLNLFGDFSATPTIATWQITFDVTVPAAMVVTWPGAATWTGDVSADCANGLMPLGWNSASSWFFTPLGYFGIDWETGNDTGSWYCAFDCSAFGRVTWVMPDASLGPSSSNTVYWVNQFQSSPNNFSSQIGQFYPSWDQTGNPWWIRVPLGDGFGDYTLEALTGEVYTLGAAPPASEGSVFGTHVGFVKAGQFGGGTK